MEELRKEDLNHLYQQVQDTLVFSKNIAKDFVNHHQMVLQYFRQVIGIPSQLSFVSNVELENYSQLILLKEKKEIIEFTQEGMYILETIFPQLQNYFLRYEELLGDTENRLRELTHLDELIHIVADLSREIRLFSINSVIVASRSGKQGMGFKSISRFIIELSDAMDKFTLELTGFQEKIKNLHQSFQERIHIWLHSYYKEKIIAGKSSIENILKITRGFLYGVSDLSSDIHTDLKSSYEKSNQFLAQMGSIGSNAPVLFDWRNIIQIFADIDFDQLTFDQVVFIDFLVKDMMKNMGADLVNLENFLNSLENVVGEDIESFSRVHRYQLHILRYFVTDNMSYWDTNLSYTKQMEQSIQQILTGYKTLLTDDMDRQREAFSQDLFELVKIQELAESYMNQFENFIEMMHTIKLLADIEMSQDALSFISQGGTLRSKFESILLHIREYTSNLKNVFQSQFERLDHLNQNIRYLMQSELVLFRDFSSHIDSWERYARMIRKDFNTLMDDILINNDKVYTTEKKSRGTFQSFVNESKTLLNMCYHLFDTLQKQKERLIEWEKEYGNFSQYYENNLYIQNLLQRRNA